MCQIQILIQIQTQGEYPCRYGYNRTWYVGVCARGTRWLRLVYAQEQTRKHTHLQRETQAHTHTNTRTHAERYTHTQVDEITVTVVPRVLGAGVTPCLRYVSASLPVSMPVCVYICLPIYVPIRTYIYMHACIHKSAPPHARTHRQTHVHTHTGVPLFATATRQHSLQLLRTHDLGAGLVQLVYRTAKPAQ